MTVISNNVQTQNQ